LTLVGDPSFDVTAANPFLRFVLFLVRGAIENGIRNAAAVVVAAAENDLNRVLDESVGGLLSEMALPDVELSFSRALIDPDGIVLGGRFDIGPAPAAVAFFTEKVPSSSELAVPFLEKQFNALLSWIPGGTIERFRWKEVTLLGGVVQGFEVRHRFVASPPQVALDATAAAPPAPAPPGSSPSAPAATATLASIFGWPPSFWCLEVHGRQFAGSGTQSVSGSVCGLTIAVPSLEIASTERLTVRVPDGRGGFLADVDPWGGFRPHAFARDPATRGFLLVHRFGGEEAVKVLRVVLATFDRASREGAARAAAGHGGAVRPVGGVTSPVHRGARHGGPARGGGSPFILPLLVVEGRASERPSIVREAAAELVTTGDAEGAWRKRLKLERPGTTVLVGPGGRELWRDAGPLRSEALEKVLAGLREAPSRPPRRTSLGLAVGLGALAPDVLFPCGLEGLVATRKLRGREFVIAFWTSWSEASLEELSRLAADASRDEGEGPVVLCVNDGEPREVAERALQERGVDLKLVTDPDRAVSRRYGVSCWPTVVRVDRKGRVAGVRFGLEVEAHDGARAAAARS
jgi:peroxiredoxin